MHLEHINHGFVVEWRHTSIGSSIAPLWRGLIMPLENAAGKTVYWVRTNGQAQRLLLREKTIGWNARTFQRGTVQARVREVSDVDLIVEQTSSGPLIFIRPYELIHP